MKRPKVQEKSVEDQKGAALEFVSNFLSSEQIKLIKKISPEDDPKKNALLLIGEKDD